MKVLPALFLLELLYVPVAFGQDLTLQTLPPGVMLDGNRPRETIASIKQAGLANRADILYLALRSRIYEESCFEAMNSLEKTKRAELLTRLLEDEKFIETLESDEQMGNFGTQMHRQMVVINQSYQLLGDPPLKGYRQLSHAEQSALAARLRAVK